MDDVVKDLNHLDSLVANDDVAFLSYNSDSRAIIQAIMLEKLHLHESMVRQKLRGTWLRYGNQNSILFHSFMKERFRKNNIVDLLSGGQLVENVKGVKALEFSHFHDISQEPSLRRPYLNEFLSTFYPVMIEIRLRLPSLCKN